LVFNFAAQEFNNMSYQNTNMTLLNIYKNASEQVHVYVTITSTDIQQECTII